MESDRVQTDLGQSINVQLAVNDKVIRQPRKRFIGRRAATERALEKTNTNSTIEDSNAVTGKVCNLV